MNKLTTVLFYLALLLPLLSHSQGWEKTYGGNSDEKVYASDKTLDGGIIMAGAQSENAGPLEKLFLYKTDAAGNLVWEYYDNNTGTNFIVYDVLSTADGNYLVSYQYGDVSPFTAIVKKITPAGTTTWQISLPSQYLNNATDLAETSDGGYILMGRNDNFSGSTGVAKVDNDGVFIWENQYVDNNDFIYPSDVIETANGDILLVTIFSKPNDDNIFIARVDSDGNFIWQQEYNNEQYETASEVIELSTGEFVIAGGNAPDLSPMRPSLLKIDAVGNQLWSQFYYPGENHAVSGLQQTEDGGFVVTGMKSDPFAGIPNDIFLFKTDSSGSLLWKNTYGRSNDDFAWNVLPADDQGFYLAGYTENIDFTTDAYLIKTDSLGVSLNNQFSGNLYEDENLDCIHDTNETGLSQWLVEAKNSEVQYFTLSDSMGDFNINLDTGSYLITAYPITPYWGICNNEFNINFDTEDSITQDIGAQIIIECPLLDVSIGTPLLRRCFENRYSIQYCNYGTVTAEDAYVEIDFDPAMIILNSSIPITSQTGNFLTFDVGDVPVDDCGYFSVDILLGDSTTCDSIPLGATHCVEAHIYPDSICLPSNNWSGASIEVDATCSGDSINFIIKNVGNAPTQSDLEYWVIEDDVILYLYDFGLDVGETLSVPVYANGATYRLEADQEPNHPGMSMPSVSVEGCSVNSTNPTLGFINIFNQDDGDTFVDIDCRENIGAYDPNDKRGFPLGYDSENYINRGQAIEYLIRFQNTGTDTAFNIVVLDTLSEFLDITTVRAGASSHPYQFNISDGRELSFKFENIMLPDSFVNEPASNGFVKFKVAQKPNLDLETKINNTAAIYFDFNPPIFTNQTLHTVGENYITVSLDAPLDKPLANVKIYPNPFSVTTTVEIKDIEIKDGIFELYDGTGRLLRQQNFSNNTFTFSKKDLQIGMYFFTIKNNQQIIASGKLIAQ